MRYARAPPGVVGYWICRDFWRVKLKAEFSARTTSPFVTFDALGQALEEFADLALTFDLGAETMGGC